jgi:hypothetical protein
MIMPHETVYMPEWLAALRCPICDGVRLSHAWKAPDHIPEVLEGFGPRHPPARRWIVIEIDTMADDHWCARKHEPVFGLQEAKRHFASTVSMAKNGLDKLREPQVRRAIVMAMHKRQRTKRGPKWLLDMDLSAATPLDEIDLAFEFIRQGAEEILRDPDLYFAPQGQPPVVNSRKSLERTLLWEPLLDLMHDFGIEDFGKYQHLIQTVRSLHLALGIDPPDANLLKQVAFRWKKRRLNSAA